MPRLGEFDDLVGQRFGRLQVVRLNGIKEVKRSYRINRYAMWECVCSCGNSCIASTQNLKSGRTKSCGCLYLESIHDGNPKHNKSKTRLYRLYSGIKNRCYNTNEPSYKNYGGRGIVMCQEWADNFMSFYEWAIANGYNESLPPSECSIERIDVNGNYCPENCEWVPVSQQGRNKRNTRYVTYKGKRMSVAEAAELSGVNSKTIYSRLARGHAPFVALRKSRKKKVVVCD